MSSTSERKVVLQELTNDRAAGVLDSAESGVGNLKEAVIQYSVVEYSTFCAKYGLGGRNLIVAFFPEMSFLELAEMPVPVHPQEQQRIWSENPVLFQKYQALIEHTGRRWNIAALQDYWINKFPITLNEVAQSHFDATAPRLQAKYTAEVKSWWLRAQGYDHLIDVDSYARRFLEKMNDALGLL